MDRWMDGQVDGRIYICMFIPTDGWADGRDKLVKRRALFPYTTISTPSGLKYHFAGKIERKAFSFLFNFFFL